MIDLTQQEAHPAAIDAPKISCGSVCSLASSGLGGSTDCVRQSRSQFAAGGRRRLVEGPLARIGSALPGGERIELFRAPGDAQPGASVKHRERRVNVNGI